ncbi:MAG: putative selenium-dependent hydroxylase accessory protein YqeC [Planctomycetes bacterium]|nr:putative selenium-dependent hydroxylase accessory protein YqeC [Planctomycetota bacterium]
MTNIDKIFSITKGDVVSFVGAGGKTSLITAFAQSLRERFSVAITTTTHMHPVNNSRFQNHLLDNNNSFNTLENLKNKSQIPVFFSSLDSDGKGLPPVAKDIKAIASLFDIVLVEADGARGKSLKIPRAHEPAVPDCSKKVILVVGMDILGKKISDDLVFHPELFKDKGMDSETLITWQVLRDILYASDSYLAKLQGKDIFLALNKSDLVDESATQSAQLMYHENIKSIILSSVTTDGLKSEEVNNSKTPVIGILLAAGQSVRYGSPKLIDTFRSQPLFWHSFKAANGSKLDKLIVVVGEIGDELIKMASNIPDNRAEFIRNPQPSKGMLSSIKIALEKVMRAYPGSAVMIMLADMPYVTSDLINTVLRAFHDSAAPVSSPFIDGRNAHPVIFHPVMFPELLNLKSERGGKEIIMSHPDMINKIMLSSPDSQYDIDTKSDSKGANYHAEIL